MTEWVSVCQTQMSTCNS